MSKSFMTPEEFAASVSPGTITGFLIDVYNERARVVTVPDQLESYYKLLDCKRIAMPEHRIGAGDTRQHVFSIICDDDALDRDPQKISAIDKDGSAMLCGNLFIVRARANEYGEFEAASLSPEDIEYLKRFILRQATRRFPKPYPMLCQCEYWYGGDEEC